ncbi:PopZ family protein [Nitrobacteraceae bacterium UC4446_H13]|jgi:cell pole-organizing protein PopZ
MTQPAKVQEPSMEEILASIRRIIADDETKTPAAEQSPAAKSAPVAAAAAKPAPVAGVAGASAMTSQSASEPPKPAAKAASNNQDDIDALMADFDAPAAPATVSKPAAPEDDVLELTDDMALPDIPDPTFDKVEPANDLEFNEVAMASERRFPAAAERSSGMGRGGMEAFATSEMLSQSTVSAVESAFSSLANTVLSNNARTLEDLVREMLRPMLKSWLDDNLPGLVERIVKAEIERVSRGR